MLRIVLARHAEAVKNTEDRHGGRGTGLTDLGRAQVAALAQDLAAYFGDIARVVAIPKPQCLETARLLCDRVKLVPEETEALPPYHLGVLDGLSRAEADARYPDHARAMDRWRRGLDEIQSLQIPGATDPVAFYASGRKFVEHLSADGRSVLVVGTRSVLVLLWNVLRDRKPVIGGGYFERPWANLEWVEFTRRTRRGKWEEQRTQRPPRELS